ncbi:MAG: pyruvate kinase, partial [Candidatus Adiutrix sp.]
MELSYRKTKIVGTIGPASQDPEILAKLIDAGLNVTRLNFSHGSPDSHRAMIETIRNLSAAKNKEIGILQDLSGPKIRLGEIKDRVLEAGETVRLIAGTKEGTDGALPVNYPYLLEDIAVGEQILLFDGKLDL